MNDLLAIACGAGLQDGLNPCIFMTCAVFIKVVIPAKAGIHNFSWMAWQRIVFVLVYASSFLEFNFGPAQIFILRKEFIFAAKILYFVLGILFLKDWFLIRRGLSAKNLTDEKIKPFVGAPLMTIILGLGLSALATLWPVNNYVMLLGNEAFLKGQWQAVMPLLAGYVFFSMWPLWFVWAFLGIKNLRPSLLKILCASIFFTASSCMIFIFK